jgi:hypothetical protein
MSVEGLWAVDHQWAKCLVELFEKCLREPSTDVANGFVSVFVRVVSREEESTEDGCTFTTSVVSTEYDKIERVADSGKIIFLDLCNRLAVIWDFNMPRAVP